MTTDMVETAQEWVNYIRMVEKPDLLIGMFQCGRDYTAHGYEMDSYKNPNGGIPVIKMVDGFDLVIMGKDVNPSVYTVVNDYGHKVPVFNVGILGGNVATTVVHFNLQEDGSMKKIIHTAITPSSDYEVNEEFISQFSHDFTSIHGWITQKIGTFDNSCHPFEDFMFQSPYRKFINDAQLWYTEADVSISAVFTRTPEFKSGDVLMSDLLYYYSFENEIVKLRMTGQEIDRFLEFTYGNQYAQMTDGNCRLLNLWTEPTTGSLARDPEGHPYLRIPLTEFFEAAGIRYTVDVSKPRGNRVEIQSFADGSPFNLRSEYTVAMNSFHGSGGDDILYHAIGWNSETLQMRMLPIHSIHMREVMAQFLSHKGLYRFEPSTDWQLLPAKWIEAEKQRLKSDRATPIFSDNWK
jgi:2',3'-cyclic-nucleotide 2'-phosphodiesterase/3'-nucleotidase